MSTKRELIRRFNGSLPLESAKKPPYTWYIDPEMFQYEKTEIFEKSWVYAGRLDQVKNPGDYFTGSILDNPYVVLRDELGELKAFHNVCQHNAAEVAKDCGNIKELMCPYHGWCYKLDGTLSKTPHLGKQTHFNVADRSLKGISVDSWGPFVFIDLDGKMGGSNNPRDLKSDLQSIFQPLENIGFNKMKFVERREYIIKCNWKVFVDNSLDGGYHVAYAHEGLADGLDFGGYKTEIFDRTSIQVCDTKGTDQRLGEKVIYAYAFPNLFINRYGNVMESNVVVPIDENTCKIIIDWYFDYENFDSWDVKKRIAKSISQSDVIQQEDVEVCESVQRGMKSMAFEEGVYSSKLEDAVYAFHILLSREVLGV